MAKDRVTVGLSKGHPVWAVDFSDHDHRKSGVSRQDVPGIEVVVTEEGRVAVRSDHAPDSEERWNEGRLFAMRKSRITIELAEEIERLYPDEPAYEAFLKRYGNGRAVRLRR